MNIEISKAKPSDSEFCYQVKKEGLKSYVEELFGWDEDEQRKNHFRRFSEHPFFLIIANDEKVGILSYRVEENLVLLNQIYILEGFRSNGIGENCIRYLQDKYKLKIKLQVLKNNIHAQAFYVRLGFQQTDKNETHIKYQMST